LGADGTDGGVKVDFKINNKALCTSKAMYGGEGHTTTINGKTWETINEMTSCDGPFPVKKGDKLSFGGVYDLKAHPLYVVGLVDTESVLTVCVGGLRRPGSRRGLC
jgi:hypothetical protein